MLPVFFHSFVNNQEKSGKIIVITPTQLGHKKALPCWGGL